MSRNLLPSLGLAAALAVGGSPAQAVENRPEGVTTMANAQIVLALRGASSEEIKKNPDGAFRGYVQETLDIDADIAKLQSYVDRLPATSEVRAALVAELALQKAQKARFEKQQAALLNALPAELAAREAGRHPISDATENAQVGSAFSDADAAEQKEVERLAAAVPVGDVYARLGAIDRSGETAARVAAAVAGLTLAAGGIALVGASRRRREERDKAQRELLTKDITEKVTEGLAATVQEKVTAEVDDERISHKATVQGLRRNLAEKDETIAQLQGLRNAGLSGPAATAAAEPAPTNEAIDQSIREDLPGATDPKPTAPEAVAVPAGENAGAQVASASAIVARVISITDGRPSAAEATQQTAEPAPENVIPFPVTPAPEATAAPEVPAAPETAPEPTDTQKSVDDDSPEGFFGGSAPAQPEAAAQETPAPAEEAPAALRKAPKVDDRCRRDFVQKMLADFTAIPAAAALEIPVRDGRVIVWNLEGTIMWAQDAQPCADYALIGQGQWQGTYVCSTDTSIEPDKSQAEAILALIEDYRIGKHVSDENKVSEMDSKDLFSQTGAIHSAIRNGVKKPS